MIHCLHYLHVKPPELPGKLNINEAFIAVVIIDSDVSPEWRQMVSEWLVECGCLFMLAWGKDCSLWDDSVDYANLEAFNYGAIPEDKFVMTSWHDGEPLEDVLEFAAHAAIPPKGPLQHLVVLDITQTARECWLRDLMRKVLSD